MKQKYSVLAVEVIALVLFSLIVFIAPIPKTGVFWLSYVFALIALVSQLAFVYVAFGSGTSARSRFYGFPIFRIGIIYLVVQLAMSLVFMLIGKWVPSWIPAILYILVLGLAAIGLIAADNVRDAVRMVEKKQADNTAMMRHLRRTAQVLASTYPEVSPLEEDLRYADPVSTKASEVYENELCDLLEQVGDCETAEDRSALTLQMQELLKQRNAVLLSSKTR